MRAPPAVAALLRANTLASLSLKGQRQRQCHWQHPQATTVAVTQCRSSTANVPLLGVLWAKRQLQNHTYLGVLSPHKLLVRAGLMPGPQYVAAVTAVFAPNGHMAPTVRLSHAACVLSRGPTGP